MSDFVLDVYSHYFKVTGYTQLGYLEIVRYCERLGQKQLVRLPTGRYIPKITRYFCASTRSRKEFRFNAHQLDDFINFLKSIGHFDNQITIRRHTPPEGITCKFVLANRFPLRDNQIEPIAYLSSNRSVKMMEFQTGFGKGICTENAIANMAKRTVVIVKGMYVEKWIKELQSDFKLDKHDLMLIRGGADLKRLIELAQEGELHAKIIIISNKTMYNYLEDYEISNGTSTVYGCKPEDFYETLGAGVRVIDETHQDFHLNYRLDLYTHIQTTIDLSATLKTDDGFIDRMYQIRFPDNIRFRNEVYDSYITVNALTYRLYNDSKRHLRFLRRGRKSYSHVDFEQSILRNSQMSQSYYELLKQAIDTQFIPVREKGQKLLIFAATTEMCTYITKRLKLNYSHLKIGKYTQEDAYEELMTCDISVSTVLSAGTAVDIPGLRMVLMSTALGSMQANLQALGRLRRLKDWPSVVPLFSYMVCKDIDQHVAYHDRKMEYFRGKCVSHSIKSLQGGI